MYALRSYYVLNLDSLADIQVLCHLYYKYRTEYPNFDISELWNLHTNHYWRKAKHPINDWKPIRSYPETAHRITSYNVCYTKLLRISINIGRVKICVFPCGTNFCCGGIIIHHTYYFTINIVFKVLRRNPIHTHAHVTTGAIVPTPVSPTISSYNFV